MYKQVAILSLLVVIVTTLPSNGANNATPVTLLSERNNSINNQPKSLLLLALIPANPDELIEESADSIPQTRRARDCSFTFARDCSVKGANLTAVYAQDQETLTKGFAQLSANRDTTLAVLRRLMDGMLSQHQNSIQTS